MKKVLALVLAAMMVLSIAPMTFAAPTVAGPYGFSATAVSGDLGSIKTSRDTAYTLKLYLQGDNGAILTKKDVTDKDVKLDAKLLYGENSKQVLDGQATIKYNSATAATNPGAAYVEVKFVKKFVKTGDVDFKFSVYLTEGKSRNGVSLDFEGNFSNPQQEAYADYDYLYLYDIPVVKAEEYVKLAELDLGNGVSIFAKLFEGKKYYGFATQTVKSEDDAVIAKYPAIGSVYYLDTIGLNSAGNYVKLDVDDKLHVYSADLEYLGTTADKLAYSTKYYVATEELDVDDAATDEPADEDNTDEPTNPDMGGDDVPANVNDNPGTGC